jgi:hypothetical protein
MKRIGCVKREENWWKILKKQTGTCKERKIVAGRPPKYTELEAVDWIHLA